ncbi:metalloendoproteinase 4-MMP [Dendrobium catenatum]|uniref:Metalloendoproteinase 1 n=1 Tax=Dendrobium catenatum TaxID=906689 RepID=A0A2I0VK01_9ASPA|nr:metalloendoproteinase 4-MMP [Dendrobium catenatum]PKU63749.1 Metalloendoproteinase 1 [Dendrobium catenatum]
MPYNSLLLHLSLLLLLLLLPPSTASISSSSGCGLPDDEPPLKSVRRFAYFPGQPRWSRPSPLHLTYSLSPTNTIDYVNRPAIDAAVRRSFARWAKVIPMTFSHSKDFQTADVKVAFYAGDHGDGQPFDGVLGVLAHAFSPENGRLHLDAAERWAVDFSKEESKVAVDLESVLTHEIGHVLGLAHSTVQEAVMYPSLSPRTKKVNLRVDDIEGVQALYGSNPNFTLSSLLEAETSDGLRRGGRADGGLGELIRSVIIGFCLFFSFIFW